MHWTDRYIGLPYLPAERDCASLCVAVLREQFGREIDLPTERACSLAGQGQQIVTLRDSYGVRTDQPEEGDAVLTWSLSGRGEPCWHLGVYCVVAGSPRMLHAFLDARQVVLHRLRDLDKYGMNLEGIYKWVA